MIGCTKCGHIYAVKYYVTIQCDQILTKAITQMDFENIIKKASHKRPQGKLVYMKYPE